jgi:hypothetical protein
VNPASWRAQVGGAVFLVVSSATLAGCTFDGCVATASNDGSFAQGGALFLDDSSAMLSGCTFDGCATTASGDGSFAEGGALFLRLSSAMLSGCRFDGCAATASGDTSYAPLVHDSGGNGGAVHLQISSSATVSGCTFDGCVATISGDGSQAAGGALFLRLSSTAILNSCTFDGCIATASGDGSFALGGALILQSGSSAMLTGCAFDGCTATASVNSAAQGGALLIASKGGNTSTTISSCTIRGSVVSATTGFLSETHGAGLFILDSLVILSNTTISDSTGPFGVRGEGESVYSLSAATISTPDAGVIYVLPAPAGRYATPAFLCLAVNNKLCTPNCPQLCAPSMYGETLLNLSVRTLGDFPPVWCAAAATPARAVSRTRPDSVTRVWSQPARPLLRRRVRA